MPMGSGIRPGLRGSSHHRPLIGPIGAASEASKTVRRCRRMRQSGVAVNDASMLDSAATFSRTKLLEWFPIPFGAGFVIAALATMGVRAAGVADFWAGPIGDHLVWISGIVGAPAGLCWIGAVLVLLMDRRARVRIIARWIGAWAGFVLLGLSLAGVVGVVDLATTQHGHGVILKPLDASSEAVGYLVLGSIAAVLLVLALQTRNESD